MFQISKFYNWQERLVLVNEVQSEQLVHSLEFGSFETINNNGVIDITLPFWSGFIVALRKFDTECFCEVDKLRNIGLKLHNTIMDDFGDEVVILCEK